MPTGAEAEGTPKGLARPRSDSAPKRSTLATSKEDGRARARAEGPAARRYDVRSRRGDPRVDSRSREGTLAQATTRDAAGGEGPPFWGAARWVGAGG